MSTIISPSGSFTSISSLRLTRYKKHVFNFLSKWDTSWDYLSYSIAYLATADGIISFYKVGHHEEGNFLHYIIINIFVALPVFYMQLVLGQFSQMSILYIRYMIPLGHGLAYTMLLNTFYDSVKFGYYMTDFLLYFLTSMQAKLPWMLCPKTSKAGTCYDGLTNGADCVENCLSNNTHISSYDYFMNVYLDISKKKYKENTFIPNIHRYVALLISWFLTFIFVYGAYKRRKKILTILLSIILILLPMLITGTVSTVGGVQGVTHMLSFEINSLYSVEKWSKTCKHILQDLSFGQAFIIFSGSRLRTTSHSGMLSVLCCFVASLIGICCSLLLQSCIGIITKAARTNIEKADLMTAEHSLLSFYVHIPQGLGYLSGPQMWSLIYFFCFICMILTNQITHLTTIQMSISDMYPSVNRYQVYLLGLFCIVGTLIGFLLLGEENFIYSNLFVSTVYSFVELFNIFIMSILVFWLYGVRRLSDDIHFLTGAQPTKYWKITWYISPVIIATTCYFHYKQFVLSRQANFNSSHRIFVVAMFFISICPVPICLIVEIFRHIQSRNLLGLFQPADMWGPSDPEERHKRQMFNPRTENRYKSRSNLCQHTCLLNSKFLKNISYEEDKCREYFLGNDHTASAST